MGGCNKMKLSEGTKSILFGSHAIIHSFFVLMAWHILYKKWPKFWQIVCIFIHDIGYFGMNHISEKSNKGHSLLGAKIGKRLFGQKAFEFIVGHSRKDAEELNLPLSELEAPDDYSWVITPMWLLKLVQDKIDIDMETWVEAVKQNWQKNDRIGGTDLLNKLRSE
jgi:hypothetical protein